MSARRKVEMVMSPAHLDRLNALLALPSTTVNAAHAFMLKLGYRISRNAVWNYSKARPLVPALHIGGDADARRKIARWSKQLSGERLLIAATLIGVLAATSGGKKGTVRRPV